jgi:hypothetical protein
MRNKFFVVFTAFFAFIWSPVRAQTYEWIRSAGSSVVAAGNCIAADAHGNIYVAGTYVGKTHFGGTELSANGRDIFIVKYDPQGKVVWAKSVGGFGDDFGNALAVDKDGNCILAGSFVGKIAFGPDTLISHGMHDMFVAKFDSKGTSIWARSAGGNYSDHATTLALDKNGNIYIGGFFKDTMWFSPDDLITGKRVTNFDMFIAKYNGKGALKWAKEISGSSYYAPEGIAIAARPKGDLYVTGHYQGEAHFESKTLTNNGTFGMFLAHYNDDGELMWVRSASKDGSLAMGKCVALDKDGNIYVAGTFSSSVVFDTITATSKNIGGTDIFLAKYTPDEQIIWLRTSSGFGAKTPIGLAVDGEGNAYLAGVFRDTAIFGKEKLTNIGSEGAYLLKYSAAGAPLWAKQGGKHGTSTAQALCLDKSGNLYATGKFTDTAEFGKTHIIALPNTQDMFTIKLSSHIIAQERKTADSAADFQFLSCDVNEKSAIATFSLPRAAFVTLGLYDEVGNIVESFVEAQHDAGTYEEKLDLKSIPAGDYYCRLQAGMDKATKKLMIKK